MLRVLSLGKKIRIPQYVSEIGHMQPSEIGHMQPGAVVQRLDM